MAGSAKVIEAEQGQPRIGAGQTVRDVLMRYPSTGPIFLQHGAMFTVKPGELYLRYDELTLEKYAALNRLALEPLLRLLSTAAAHEDRPPAQKNLSARGPPIGKLGYAGGYREAEPNVALAPVVEVAAARGPG